jgi:hypothetical protein
MKWKTFRTKQSWSSFGHQQVICLQELRKITKNLKTADEPAVFPTTITAISSTLFCYKPPTALIVTSQKPQHSALSVLSGGFHIVIQIA